MNNKKEENSKKRKSHFNFKKYDNTIRSLINDEANKPKEERSRDIKALILTIIIICILIFIAWKIPFIREFLFP